MNEIRSKTQSSKTAKPRKAPVAPWLKETAWVGAEGVATKIRRELTPSAKMPVNGPETLKALLARPEWKGAEIVETREDAQAIRVWAALDRERVEFPAQGCLKARHEWLPVQGCSPGFVRTVYVIRHPSGAEVRWHGATE